MRRCIIVAFPRQKMISQRRRNSKDALPGSTVRTDDSAHAGGLAAGYVLGSVMELREDTRRRRAGIWMIIAGGLLLALAPGFVLLAWAR